MNNGGMQSVLLISWCMTVLLEVVVDIGQGTQNDDGVENSYLFSMTEKGWVSYYSVDSVLLKGVPSELG